MNNYLLHILKKPLLIIFVLLSINHVNAQWTSTGPLNGYEVTSIVAIDSNIFAGLNGGGVYVSTNNGGSWTPVNSGLANLNVMALGVSGTNIFAGLNGGIYLSTNKGLNWSPVNNGLQSTSKVVYSFASSGSYVFAGIEGNGVYVTTNNGTLWAPANTGLGTIFPTSLAADGSNVYVASQYGKVYISRNYGGTWTTPVNNGISNYQLNALLPLGAKIFVGSSSHGVFLSTDSGANWSLVNTGLPANYNIFSLTAADSSKGVCKPAIFAGTQQSGVYQTPENNISWTSISAGLPSGTYIPSMLLAGNTLFAGTNGKGVYQQTLSSLGGSLTPPQITAGKTTFCAYDSAQLCVPAGFSSYKWSTGASGNCLVAKQAGNYYVSVTDNNGCSAVSGAVTLKVNSIPVDSISAGKNIFCPGDSASVCALSGFTSYQWNTGISGTGACIEAKQAGNYYVTVTDNNGCTAESNHIAISVYPVPSVSIIRSGDTLSSYGAVSYQWYLNNLPVSTGTGPVYIAKEQGSYSVEVTDSNGCTAASNPIIITGIHEPAADRISLYPNPANNIIVIEMTGNGEQLLQVFDLTGKLLLSQNIQNNRTTIDASSLAVGIYTLSMKSSQGIETKKLIIAK